MRLVLYTAVYQSVYSSHSINARCAEPTLGNAYRYNTEVIFFCLYTFRLVSSDNPRPHVSIGFSESIQCCVSYLQHVMCVDQADGQLLERRLKT